MSDEKFAEAAKSICKTFDATLTTFPLMRADPVTRMILNLEGGLRVVIDVNHSAIISGALDPKEIFLTMSENACRLLSKS